MGSNKRRVFLILAILLLLNCFYAFAQSDVDKLKEKKQNTEKQMENVKDQIDNLKKEAKDINVQMEELDKQIETAASELSQVENELTRLNAEINKTVAELEKAERNIKEKEEVFNDRLRVMYKKGNVGLLEVLLSSSNISELLSRREMIQAIVDHDVELIKYMKEQREIINKKNIELKAQRASVEAAKSELEKKRNNLETASRAKELYMKDLEKNLAQAEAEYDKLNQLAKEIESEIVRRQRVQTPYSGGAMAWPVPGNTRISSYFGYRIHPIYKVKKLHTGIDIPAATGTNVIAASNGVVIYSGTLGSYGKVVMVDHGGSIVTLYAHNSYLTVSEGQTVSRGTVIAKIGSTGASTGPHLHFEVRKNGQYVDPLPWLKGN